MSSDDRSEITLNAVAIRLPEFSPNEPITWFRRAETKFRLRNVSQASTKADYVLEALPESIFSRIAPWLDQQPDELDYNSLKQHLLTEFTLSPSERAHRVLALPTQPLGDRTPTQVWAEIQSLCRLPDIDPNTQNHREIDLKTEIWLMCLPHFIRSLIRTEDPSKDIAALIKEADAIMLSHKAANHRQSHTAAAITEHTDIQAVRQNSTNRSESNHKHPRKQNIKPNEDMSLLNSHAICGYHVRFGKRARNCATGCQWSTTVEANSAIHSQPHPGFHIYDENSGKSFLVDTGALRSIFPVNHRNNNIENRDGIKLVAANGSPIKTYGEQMITLKFSGRSYTWPFIRADVRRPLLGADFLAHHNLLVDVAGRRLVNPDSYHQIPISVSNVIEENPVYVCGPASKYDRLTDDFSDVFKLELRQTPGTAAKHNIVHYIKTTGPPVHSKFRRLNPEKYKIAKAAFSEMEKMGVCSKASSPWASPLHMTPKKDGTWRPCGDYRRLNMVTEPDHYPMPNVTDLTNNIGKARIFSKLDLLKGYFQIPVHPADAPKTAIITPFGSYIFHFATFGLRNSGATFQRMMDQIFGNLPFCCAYVDDILVYSNNHADHLEHLRRVLQCLQDNGLIVRRDKSVFGVSSVEFLGHHISSDGIRPLTSKVDAVTKFPRPTTIKQLQEFLGMINYYHRFIPHAAHILAPLYDLVSGNQKIMKPWESTHETAFVAAKHALADAVTLTTPDPSAPLYLVTDASNVAIGATLEQDINGTKQPLAFFSRKLRKPEQKYSTFDRELLAIHLAIRHFRHMLEGSQFTICTDHKPLVTALSKSSDAWTARQQRHLSAIAETCCNIKYLRGKENPVADALSRVEISNIQLGIDYADLAAEQKKDADTISLNSKMLKITPILIGDNYVLCDLSTGRPRPLVPTKFRRTIFNTIHGLAHPSIRSTIKLMTAKFIWSGIKSDVRTWTRCCEKCQKSKVLRHTKSNFGQFPQPSRRFAHIHVDVVGPLPPSEGQRYLFTVIDRSTRWTEATPMSESTSVTCAKSLLNSWISRFGLPEHITSDRGTTFTSELWTALARLLGVKLHYTTAYHPQANGMVERWHRSLKTSLIARCSGNNWTAHLPWILLGLRTTPKEGLTYSAAEMVYGQPLVVPGEFFPHETGADNTEITRLRHIAHQFTPCRASRTNHNATYVPTDLRRCEYVFIRDDSIQQTLSPPYKGPFMVLSKGDKTFQLQIGNRQDWVSIDRLKPAYMDPMDLDHRTVTRYGRISRPTKFYTP